MSSPRHTAGTSLAELPDGTVKIPLGLPHGAAWPVVAQVAALSQRKAGCTASIAYLAERLGIHASTVYDALNVASAWIITDTITRVTRRYLAPLPEDAAWTRISYRAAAGVGCHSVHGVWTPRRNRSALLELYCRLRRDEAVGIVRSQDELAADLGVTSRTVRSLLGLLEADGWITSRRAGRMIAYCTHDTPLRAVAPGARAGEEPPAKPARAAELTPAASRSRKPARNDLGRTGETISETETAQKGDPEAGLEKRDHSPLAVGEVQHRSDTGAQDALTRERQVGNMAAMRSRPRRPGGALSVMAVLPLSWQLRMSERERERVLEAVEREMGQGRTAAQMTARVRRRLAVWSGRMPRRAVAAALTVISRGYDCPRPDCEDHMLPSGYPCLACEEIGVQVNHQRRQRRHPSAPHAASPAPCPAQPPSREPADPARSAVEATREHVQHLPVAAREPHGLAEHARALLLATCPRTAAAMRAAAVRTGRQLPEPTFAIASHLRGSACTADAS
ncbi:winged helix-turn-helix domain-containing protein [Nonomuraea ceibae]|uniref:winged helix-turn-helix domain-containing protein n=1 Tax=Nonomuraea ceibae TaxID=1935170 RepID=UPI001C5E48A4|nr:winged helix-turn-helix domain-containing protein [Nonomuraea ceibae]